MPLIAPPTLPNASPSLSSASSSSSIHVSRPPPASQPQLPFNHFPVRLTLVLGVFPVLDICHTGLLPSSQLSKKKRSLEDLPQGQSPVGRSTLRRGRAHSVGDGNVLQTLLPQSRVHLSCESLIKADDHSRHHSTGTVGHCAFLKKHNSPPSPARCDPDRSQNGCTQPVSLGLLADVYFHQTLDENVSSSVDVSVRPVPTHRIYADIGL